MKTARSRQPAFKPGANRGEPAHKPRKHDANFAQSRDIREDRGLRQMKQTRPRRNCPGQS